MRRRAATLAATLALATAGVMADAPSAGAVSVSTETEFRNAWADASESAIDLANDIDLTCTNAGTGDGVPVRASTTTAITVDGHGHTLRQTCAIGTNNGVLRHNGTAAVALQNITISGGLAQRGGGYRAFDSAALTVTNSTFTGNTATAEVIADGGAIRTFTGDVTIVDSTIAGNTATTSIDPHAGAISSDRGAVTVINSTISGNAAIGDLATGGAIYAQNGDVSVINSTVTDNRAAPATPGGSTNSGGIFAGTGDLTLVYSTVVANAATQDGANLFTTGSFTSFASVVAMPEAGAANCDLDHASLSSHGFNFSDDTSCELTAGTDRQGAGDPGLGELAPNGGSTLTRLPQAGSPLVDVVPDTACQDDGATGITTDQRGFPRPEVTGGRCDVGAVEVQRGPGPPTPPPEPGPPDAESGAPVRWVLRFTG